MLQWFSEIRISAENTGIYKSSSLFVYFVYAAYILMIFVFINVLLYLYIRIIISSLGFFWSLFEYVVLIRNLLKNSLKLCVFFSSSIFFEVSHVNGNVKYSCNGTDSQSDSFTLRPVLYGIETKRWYR
jgi:hypothetical protein